MNPGSPIAVGMELDGEPKGFICDFGEKPLGAGRQRPVIEMPVRGSDYPFHLVGIEGLSHHIVSADIEHFGPQRLVSLARCNDKLRGFGAVPEVL